MPADDSIPQSIDRHLAGVACIRNAADTIARIAETIRTALGAGNKVLTCGNGGSAAEALHLAEELIGRFHKTRRAFAAVALAADPTALTCIANDFGYEQVFARQVEGLGRKGDVLVGLTTSGKSPNVLRAFEAARKLGMTTIGLLGGPGSPAEPLCDIALTTAAPESAHVQEIHLMTIHLVLEYLDETA